MNNQLQIFKNEEFGQVRVLEINREPWFVGKDVASVLGYTDTFGALKKHVDDEDKQNCRNNSFESNRGLTVINESGLYSLILSSKLPTAKKFKRWVTSEVLPSIRKTGSYQIPKMSKELQAIFMIDGKTEELKKEIYGVRREFEDFKENAPLFNSECDELMSKVKSVATKTLGGYGSRAYNDKSLRSKVYADIQHLLRREFGVQRYKAIKRCQMIKALEIVNNYSVPTILNDEIITLNNQVLFENI